MLMCRHLNSFKGNLHQMTIEKIISDLIDGLGELGPIVGGFVVILIAGIIGQVYYINMAPVMLGVGILVVVYIICKFSDNFR